MRTNSRAPTGPRRCRGVLISANPKPAKSPVAFVQPSKFIDYELNADVDYVPALQARLAGGRDPLPSRRQV